MSVSSATVANGFATPTSQSGTGVLSLEDSLYLSDFAEDLTIALGKMTVLDSESNAGSPTPNDLRDNSSVQIDVADIQRQVLPPQVLNQAISRAILASHSESSALFQPGDDSVDVTSALGSDSTSDMRFLPVQEVLDHWDARYFNVARADIPLPPANPDRLATNKLPEANSPAAVVTRAEPDGTNSNERSELANSGLVQPLVQAVPEEGPLTTSLNIESVFDAGPSVNDRVALLEESTESEPQSGSSGSPTPQDSTHRALVSDVDDGRAVSPRLGGLTDVDKIKNNNRINVPRDFSAALVPSQPTIETSSILKSGVSPLSLPHPILRPVGDEALGAVDSSDDTAHESMITTRGGGGVVRETGLTTADDSEQLTNSEKGLTAEAPLQISVVPISFASQSMMTTDENVTGSSPSLSKNTTFVAEVVQPGQHDFSLTNATLTDNSAAGTLTDVAATGVLTQESVPIIISKSSADPNSAKTPDMVDGTTRAISAEDTWLDHLSGTDDVGTKIVENGIGPAIASGKVVSGDLLNSILGIGAVPSIATSKLLSGDLMSSNAVNQVSPSATASIPVSIGDQDDSIVHISVSGQLQDRVLGQTLTGTRVVERYDSRREIVKSDVVREAKEVNSADGEQGALDRVTSEPSSLAGLSSVLGTSPQQGSMNDRLGIIASQPQAGSTGPQNAGSLVNSLSIEVKQLLTSGGGSVRMVLTPPEQGVLQLDLVVSDLGTATLEVYGVTESVRERLESGSTALQRQFEQMGLTLSLSLFDHRKGFDPQSSRDSQMMTANSTERTADQLTPLKKRSGGSTDDDTGRMINLIA